MSFLSRWFGSRPAQTPEQQFWDWFGRNSPRLAGISSGQDPAYAEANAELQRVHEGLVFEIEGARGRRRAIISADGIRERFPAVIRTVSAAPSLDGWEIVAFRQRMDAKQLQLSFQGISVGPDDVWFEARHGGGDEPIHVMFYMQGIENRDSPGAGAPILLVDHLVGEYDSVMRVAPVDVRALPESPEAHGLTRLTELPAIIDQVFPRGPAH